MFNIKFDVDDFFLTITEDHQEADRYGSTTSGLSDTSKERRMIIKLGKQEAKSSFNFFYYCIHYFTAGFYTMIYYYTG